MTRRLALVLAALLLLAAAPAGAAGIETKDAWARSSTGRTGAAYVTVVNGGADADRLLSVSAPVAAKVELHETRMANGVMEMRPAAPVELKPGAKIEMKPGGYHVMLIGLNGPLKEGTSFDLTLTFEKAGTVVVPVPVRKGGAPAHGGHAMPGME